MSKFLAWDLPRVFAMVFALFMAIPIEAAPASVQSTALGAVSAPEPAPSGVDGTGSDKGSQSVVSSSAADAGTLPAASPRSQAGELAGRVKARLSYDTLSGFGYFEKSGSRFAFALGVPWAIFNWDKLIPFDPPEEDAVGLSFSAASSTVIQKAFEEAEAAARSHFSIAAILIDPGHGGKDPGAIGEHTIAGKKLRVVEKEITLSISHRLYDSLKAKYPDKRILITREGDSYPSLEDRVDMANSVELAPNEAIIYVSIHANSSFNKNAKGFEVWYLNPEYRRTLVDAKTPEGLGQEIAPILNAMLEEEFTTESIILARNIMSGLQALIGAESPNRGIRADEWFVVRNARMPSVLIEAGFVTNPDEGKLLSRDDYLLRVADGVYNGLVNFVEYFESMRGSPSQ